MGVSKKGKRSGGAAIAASDHPLATPAEWLEDEGKKKWLEVLADNPQLEKNDADFLALYCEAHQELHRALKSLKEEESEVCTGPNGALYPHPAVGQKNKAIERIRKFGRELGLAKSSRKTKSSKSPLQGKMKPA